MTHLLALPKRRYHLHLLAPPLRDQSYRMS